MTYDLFAPNQVAMDEAREQIDELLQEQVKTRRFSGLNSSYINTN